MSEVEVLLKIAHNLEVIRVTLCLLGGAMVGSAIFLSFALRK